jgi:uncharacterized membrane protein YgcG
MPLSSNSATVIIPAGTLPTGIDNLTASYTPDAQSTPVFYSASNTTMLIVGVPSFAIAGTPVYIGPGATSGNTSDITVTPTFGFSGNVTLSGAVTASPAGAQYPPTLSFGVANPVGIANGVPSYGILTITTTAPAKAALVQPKLPGVPWYTAGGAALACFLLFGLPAKRRRWRTMLGTLALLVALAGGVISCGGGAANTGSGGTGGGGTGGGGTGGGGTGGGSSNSGTTLGDYTITVTGTSGTTTATGTVTLKVL